MMFSIYKKGQGKYTRIISAVVILTIVGLGCLRLYKKLEVFDLGLWVETMVPVAVFAVLAIIVFWLTNKPSMADFMISAEGEMKKVNWSSKSEVAVSTFVVIVVVVFMAAMLGVVDLGFSLFFNWLLA